MSLTDHSGHNVSPPPSVLANLHDELLSHLHRVEMDLANMNKEIITLRAEADTLIAWMRSDTEKSQWYYENRGELKAVVESSRWVKMTRRALAWLFGAIAGVVMAIQQIEIWVREHYR